LGLGLSFCILATTTSVAAAYFEGRLTTPRPMMLANGNTVEIIPFDRNLSTLVDFILLNPFVIYFLERSRLQRRSVNKRLNLRRELSPYHRVGIMIICAALGVFAMTFYVGGSYSFDATMIPAPDGSRKITVTGWIVYSWTALYIALLLFFAIEHGAHIARLMVLPANRVPYAPFHPDGAGGVRFLMEPSLSAGYAMIGLLATFLVFIIHDRIIYHIESNRLAGFGIYIFVAVPLFALPFCKLHQLMKARRDEFLFESLDDTLADARNASDRKDWAALAGCIAAIESADKYRKLVCTFPVWPIPFTLALPSLGSIAAALIPFVQKLAWPPPSVPG
ncbi:MAG: hypothetical protein ACRETL_04950, partial [Gammaproteobacteria bacterium]